MSGLNETSNDLDTSKEVNVITAKAAIETPVEADADLDNLPGLDQEEATMVEDEEVVMQDEASVEHSIVDATDEESTKTSEDTAVVVEEDTAVVDEVEKEEEESSEEEDVMQEESPAMDDTEEAMDEPSFDIFNMFNEQATSSELGAGVHERIKLISIDISKRKDNNGNPVKKQLFLKFKKFNAEGVDVGEKEISFFLVDPAKESAVDNLHSFIAQTREILTMYLTNAEIEAGFRPLDILYDADNDDRDIEAVKKDFLYDNLKKKVMKKASFYPAVENAVCSQFKALLEDKVGFESTSFRLKLEESQDNKYIQIPRFDRFVERAGVEKEESVLYTNNK